MQNKPMEKLGDYLQKLEASAKVSLTTGRNQVLKQGCEEIVHSLLRDISQKDPRFSFDFFGSGSCYDGVKVGEPDEFDFLAEIKDMSLAEAVTMATTSDPGFVQIEVPSMDLKRKWMDCLVLPDHLCTASAESMYHTLPGESQEDNMKVNESDLNSTCILAPFKVQRLFKEYVDICMRSITLPDNWDHSGYQKPNYSGCRRHGPATMLQFAYIVPDEKIIINIDITLGIAVPVPTNAAKLNLYVFDNVKGNRMMHDKLQEIFSKGPQLHVIPLYSNVLIKTRRYQNKFAWRISCSLVETAILDCFPDNGPKLCMRMLKAVRDKYLCDRKINTRRRRRKKKRQTKAMPTSEENANGVDKHQGKLRETPKAASKPDGSVGSFSAVGTMPTSEENANGIDQGKVHEPPKYSSEADGNVGSLVDAMPASEENANGIDEHQHKIHETSKVTSKPDVSVGSSGSVVAMPTSEENANDVDGHQGKVHETPKATSKADGSVGLSSSVGPMPESEYTPRQKGNADGMDKHRRKAASKPSHSISSCSSMGAMPASEYTRRMKETQMTWMNIKAKYMKLNKAEGHGSHKPERTVGPTSPILVPPTDTTGGSNQGNRAYEDLSDTTELEEISKEEAFQEFKKTRIMFQRKDISDMVAEQGSGEYYGPKTYMSSIEIKTYVLRLIAGHADSEFWSLDNIVRHVNDFLRSYHTILLERKMMKNFFFDSMVCAPISEEQRLKALEKFNVLFEELNKVMEGGTPRLTYYAKGSSVIPFCFKQE